MTGIIQPQKSTKGAKRKFYFCGFLFYLLAISLTPGFSPVEKRRMKPSRFNGFAVGRNG
jgi:hypothetical protein